MVNPLVKYYNLPRYNIVKNGMLIFCLHGIQCLGGSCKFVNGHGKFPHWVYPRYYPHQIPLENPCESALVPDRITGMMGIGFAEHIESLISAISDELADDLASHISYSIDYIIIYPLYPTIFPVYTQYIYIYISH